jgi:hypothetical protein
MGPEQQRAPATSQQPRRSRNEPPPSSLTSLAGVTAVRTCPTAALSS